MPCESSEGELVTPMIMRSAVVGGKPPARLSHVRYAIRHLLRPRPDGDPAGAPRADDAADDAVIAAIGVRGDVRPHRGGPARRAAHGAPRVRRRHVGDGLHGDGRSATCRRGRSSRSSTAASRSGSRRSRNRAGAHGAARRRSVGGDFDMRRWSKTRCSRRKRTSPSRSRTPRPRRGC